jgi:hypothetical protein
MRCIRLFSCALLLLVAVETRASAESLLLEPAHASATVSASHFDLSNTVLTAKWSAAGSHLGTLSITDKLTHRSSFVLAPFSILLKSGAIFDASDVQVTGLPQRKMLTAAPDASCLAERFPGVSIELPWKTEDGSLSGTWSIVLRDGSNYLRQVVTITAGDKDQPISRVEMIDLPLMDAAVVGSVEGSPIVAGNLFLGFEHPMSISKVTAGHATAWIERDLPLQAKHSITYSSVVGVARPGQMRRDFLAYVERERAHPYRTFLHYNSWYDLGFFTPYDEAGALDRINTFGRELTEKRGVTLDSFLFDDGWDNHHSLWQFNSGFPDGFTKVRQAAEKYGADPGVWMSPWGGYSKPQQERLAYGKSEGYEIVSGGYALSGPKYYDAFRDVSLNMVKQYGVNQFKFDGTGNVNSVVKGSRFDSDFDAMIHLIYARYNKNLNTDPGNDFRNEVRSYFGTGMQLQEMYITPSLLTQQNWDDLADAAKWSRANADTLKDTHWVGGDPTLLQVYGWASWSPRVGILTLRNPSDKPQSITLKLTDVFQLPAGAPHSYLVKSPWKEDAARAAVPLNASQPHKFELAPFEVLTLEMKPTGAATGKASGAMHAREL